VGAEAPGRRSCLVGKRPIALLGRQKREGTSCLLHAPVQSKRREEEKSARVAGRKGNGTEKGGACPRERERRWKTILEEERSP